MLIDNEKKNIKIYIALYSLRW